MHLNISCVFSKPFKGYHDLYEDLVKDCKHLILFRSIFSIKTQDSRKRSFYIADTTAFSAIFVYFCRLDKTEIGSINSQENIT